MSRCSMCHAAEPVWAGIAAAPKGIRLDDPAAIKLHAKVIAINAALSSAMPPGNVTEMTDGRAPGARRRGSLPARRINDHASLSINSMP